jgi:hypothetical protein
MNKTISAFPSLEPLVHGAVMSVLVHIRMLNILDLKVAHGVKNMFDKCHVECATYFFAEFRKWLLRTFI